MRKPLVVSLIVVGSLALPAAAATPPFGDLQVLSPATHLTYQPVVAIDTDGHATAVWNYSSSSRQGMRFADRAPGEGFAPAYPLQTPGSNQFAYPAIDTATDGTTVVAWVDEIQDRAVVMFTHRHEGGEWSLPAAIAVGDSGQDSYSELHVAASSSGRMAVSFWHYLEDGSHNIEAMVSDGDEFGEPQVLDNRMGTESVGNFGPNIGIDNAGNAMVLWESYDDAEVDPRTFVMYATAPAATGTFGAPAQIAEVHQDGVDPRLAVNPSGSAVAIWKQTQESADEYLNSARGTTTTGLTVLGQVPGGRPDWIDLALDENGQAIAARRGLTDTAEEIQASVLPNGASAWGASQTLDDNLDTETSLETSDETLDVVASNGTGIVAFAREDPNDYMPVQVAVLDPVTRMFEDSVIVSNPAGDVDRVRVDMNAAGDTVLVWRDDYRVYSLGTWAAPENGSLTVRVSKRKQLQVSGMLTPHHGGEAVAVTLYRKRAGTFKKVAGRTATANATGEYSTSFSRPNAGSCKVTSVFSGDGLIQRASASKTFSC